MRVVFFFCTTLSCVSLFTRFRHLHSTFYILTLDGFFFWTGSVILEVGNSILVHLLRFFG